MARKSSGRRVAYRSSVSGKFVKGGYAKKHPRTTEKESIRKK